MEAKVVMDIAQVDGTAEFPLAIRSKNLRDDRRTTVDLNEAPFKIQEEHLIRMKAHSRTGNDASYTYIHLHDYIFCFLDNKSLIYHTFILAKNSPRVAPSDWSLQELCCLDVIFEIMRQILSPNFAVSYNHSNLMELPLLFFC